MNASAHRKKKALIVMSAGYHATAQETLRVQDIAAALVADGWSVDVLAPRRNPVLALALPVDVRVFALPSFPFTAARMFFRAVALIRREKYDVVHAFDDGISVARLADRATVEKFAYIAEVHHPIRAHSAVRHASAVIITSDAEFACFSEPPPMARVSVLPEPHTELSPVAFTFAEFREALGHVYTYVSRERTEVSA